ncbi:MULTISPECIES: hypothetical protein [Bizionia]|uniref:Uncharacterized protein n=1 Tax=Bizionia algoritergicola TaxID=291187 RepID=A0A5D0QZF8_9FLAO|nr:MULTISPECIES: hypothetical protein [Bizionia]OBX22457.1 hypothetical protein BAA08_08480 [Bizionia sp. APA-3]TYB74642.1 hypothetical protein ES675_00440 [Bizionia algoritergicola]
MKIFKFFQYAYLIFAILFIYVAAQKYMENEVIDYASILLAAAAIFMFFFRKKFNKRFEERDRK